MCNSASFVTLLQNTITALKNKHWPQLTKTVAMLLGKTFAKTAKDDVTAAENPIAFMHRVIKQSTMKTVPSDTWSRNLQNKWYH